MALKTGAIPCALALHRMELILVLTLAGLGMKIDVNLCFKGGDRCLDNLWESVYH